MIRSNHEKASGGPFFRCLQRRADTSSEDLYDIYYYNMGHTDPERFGLQGPSVLSLTDGSTPNTALFARNADWSWFDDLGIDGWVPSAGRGAISGVGLSNMKSGILILWDCLIQMLNTGGLPQQALELGVSRRFSLEHMPSRCTKTNLKSTLPLSPLRLPRQRL